MKRVAALLTMIMTSAILPGCPDAAGNAPRSGVVNPVVLSPPSAPAPAPSAAAPTFMVIRLRLAAIQVPLGKASGSEALWSYLNEEALGAKRQRTLGLNGLRVGLGQADDWPDVAKVLRKLTGRGVEQGSSYVLPGRTIQIPLQTHQPGQTLFIYHNDQTLTGRDYPAGDSILNVMLSLDPDDPSRVLVTAQPQIRTTRKQPKVIKQSGWPVLTQVPSTISFKELTLQTFVPSGDFLVIGPGIEARRPTSPGHHFLLQRKEGMEYETVLVLIPDVMRKIRPDDLSSGLKMPSSPQ